MEEVQLYQIPLQFLKFSEVDSLATLCRNTDVRRQLMYKICYNRLETIEHRQHEYHRKRSNTNANH